MELGGNPTDPKNLWPQPIQEAHVKDRLETALNRGCGGKMTLRDAHQCIMTGWAACAHRMHTGAP